MRRLVFLAVAAAAACGGASTAVAAPPVAPSLDGELVNSVDQSQTTSHTCNAGGATFTFHASGAAVGPYPGTYDETGTVTAANVDLIVNPGFATGEITSFHATFTIQSPVGTVTGTKDLITPMPALDAFCSTGPDPLAQFNLGTVGARYAACIQTADGRFSDSGIASSDFAARSDVQFNDFGEFFASSRGALATPDPACSTQSCTQNAGQANAETNDVDSASDCSEDNDEAGAEDD